MELDFELDLDKGLVQDQANESVPGKTNVEPVFSPDKTKAAVFQ